MSADANSSSALLSSYDIDSLMFLMSHCLFPISGFRVAGARHHHQFNMPRMPKKVSHLMIRFALHGCTNRPFYHIVLMPNRANRNAKPLEQIGSYDPMPNTNQEKLVAVNFERLRHWLACGAQCSKPVEQLLGV